MTGPASTPVLGTVSLDVTGTIVTFTPTSNLASSTSYTATITTGITDLLGDPLATRSMDVHNRGECMYSARAP